MEVRNVSSRVLSELGISIHYRLRRGSGWGGVWTDTMTPLRPGDTVSLEVRGGVETAAAPSEEAETQTIAAVEWVRVGACVYNPAQVLPASTPPPATPPSFFWR